MGDVYVGGRGSRQEAAGKAKSNFHRTPFLQAPPQAGAAGEQLKRSAKGGPSTSQIVFKFCCGPGAPCTCPLDVTPAHLLLKAFRI